MKLLKKGEIHSFDSLRGIGWLITEDKKPAFFDISSVVTLSPESILKPATLVMYSLYENYSKELYVRNIYPIE